MERKWFVFVMVVWKKNGGGLKRWRGRSRMTCQCGGVEGVE